MFCCLSIARAPLSPPPLSTVWCLSLSRSPTLLLSGSLVSSAPSLSPNRSCSRLRARARSFPRSFSAERAQRGGRTDKSVLSVENGLVLTLAMNHLSPCRSFFFFLAQSRPPSFLSQELDPSAPEEPRRTQRSIDAGPKSLVTIYPRWPFSSVDAEKVHVDAYN